MDIRTLTAELSVSPQIAAADMHTLAAAGLRSVICNRPDGEGSDQPVFSEMERAAVEHGFQVRYLPAVAGKVTDEQGQAFGALMSELPKPVLAEFTHCGKLAPSLPQWLIDETRPSTLAWYLKERILPPMYREAMRKGREWLAQPEMVH